MSIELQKAFEADIETEGKQADEFVEMENAEVEQEFFDTPMETETPAEYKVTNKIKGQASLDDF